MADSTVCQSKWKPLVEPRRAKPKTYRKAPTHWLNFYEEAVIESEARTKVVLLLQFFVFASLWFHMWRLGCPYLFLIFFFLFGASGGLCFVIVAFHGNLHLHVCFFFSTEADVMRSELRYIYGVRVY